MERNDFSTDGVEQSNAGMSAGAASGATDSGSMSGTSDDTSSASGRLSGAREKLSSIGSTVRDRAGTAKNSLADALESGAEKLRSRQGNTLAGATDGGSIALENDGRVAQASDRLAGGLDSTAQWIRDADIEGMKTGIERQVKEHPGRTLLIAVGLGYLLGKALRK